MKSYIFFLLMSSTLLRLLRASQPRTWPQPRPSIQRGIRYSFPSRSDLAPEPPSQEELEYDEELAAKEEEDELADDMEKESESDSDDKKSAAPSESSYNQFLAGEDGTFFKLASPANWLGEGVGFS